MLKLFFTVSRNKRYSGKNELLTLTQHKVSRGYCNEKLYQSLE